MPKVTRKESAQPLQAVVQPGQAAAAEGDGKRQRYAPAAAATGGGDGEEEKKVEFRRVNVPQHRIAPLKDSWLEIYEPVTKLMKLDMRMNLKTRKVEIKTLSAAGRARAAGPSGATGLVIDSSGALQRAADFVHAFILGFSVQDAIALLRMDDLYIEKFEIKDVKVSTHCFTSYRIARGFCFS